MEWHWTWQDPVALGIVTFAVGIALGIAVGRRRKARRSVAEDTAKSSRTPLKMLERSPDE